MAKILTWKPDVFDQLASAPQNPDVINARKRISGYWGHNRFFNYRYEPSRDYLKHIKKHANSKFTQKFKI